MEILLDASNSTSFLYHVVVKLLSPTGINLASKCTFLVSCVRTSRTGTVNIGACWTISSTYCAFCCCLDSKYCKFCIEDWQIESEIMDLLGCTWRFALVTASPNALRATTEYVPASSAVACKISSATNPNELISFIRDPIRTVWKIWQLLFTQ